MIWPLPDDVVRTEDDYLFWQYASLEVEFFLLLFV